jgi:hypothetical protein
MMTIADWLTILAIIAGPIIAVQLTRFLDERREVRDRKLQVFKTLMATRAYNVSWAHVEALNRIDLEFDKRRPKEKAVIDAWIEYLDLLANSAMSPDQWIIKRVDLLVELLHKMAIVLDYDFDKVHIKNSTYSPMAHGTLEQELEAIRRGALELLDGKRSLPVVISQSDGKLRADLSSQPVSAGTPSKN